MSHPAQNKNKDPRWRSLRSLSKKLKIVKTKMEKEKVALTIINLQRDMGLPISNFSFIFNPKS